MPSYVQYKKMMAVLDEDSDIESWITVNGNHIPIRKGQTKEEAVKSFVEKKQGKSGSGEGSASHGSGEYKKQESKSDPDFDVVRKNAKANPNLYGGKYTQKSKAEAYKEYKADTEKKDPWTPKTKENSRLYIENGALNYEYTDPDGLHFKVWESGNDYPSWKATNRSTELFETREDAIRAAEQQLKEDKTKYGDFTNKRNKDFMWRRYKNGFEDTEPEMGTGEKAKETPKVKEQKPMDKLITSFSDHYDKLYKSQYLDDKYEHLLGEWDKRIKDPEFKKQVQKFVEARGDFISSDREVKAYMLALQDQEKAAQAPKAKNPDSALVSAVAKALNTTPADAETEIEGAAQHISDLMKAKDLRNGDVEETLLGLGVESDYAEEFMEWVSGAGKKTKAPKVKYVDAKKWNDPRSDPWYALYE